VHVRPLARSRACGGLSRRANGSARPPVLPLAGGPGDRGTGGPGEEILLVRFPADSLGFEQRGRGRAC
jgi:hypothetical protein